MYSVYLHVFQSDKAQDARTVSRHVSTTGTEDTGQRQRQRPSARPRGGGGDQRAERTVAGEQQHPGVPGAAVRWRGSYHRR